MRSQPTSIIHVRRRWGRRTRGVGGALPARPTGPIRVAVVSALVPALIAVAALVAPSEARAAVVISGVRIASATSTSFTVTLNSLGSGWTYRVYASTNRPDIHYDNLPTAPHVSGRARTPRIGLSGLRYTTKPVWYRVQATKGIYRRTSEIFSVGSSPRSPRRSRWPGSGAPSR
jgi:hypothetical protein